MGKLNCKDAIANTYCFVYYPSNPMVKRRAKNQNEEQTREFWTMEE